MPAAAESASYPAGAGRWAAAGPGNAGRRVFGTRRADSNLPDGRLLGADDLHRTQAIGPACPEDVALVGFDDVVPPGLEGLELSSVAQDFEGVGVAAGEMVLQRIVQPEAPSPVAYFPRPFVVRASSAPPPVTNRITPLEPMPAAPTNGGSRRKKTAALV